MDDANNHVLYIYVTYYIYKHTCTVKTITCQYGSVFQWFVAILFATVTRTSPFWVLAVGLVLMFGMWLCSWGKHPETAACVVFFISIVILHVKCAFLVAGDSVGWTIQNDWPTGPAILNTPHCPRGDAGFLGDWSWCDGFDVCRLAPLLHHLAYVHL